MALPRGFGHLPTGRIERGAKARSAVAAAAFVEEARRWSPNPAQSTSDLASGREHVVFPA